MIVIDSNVWIYAESTNSDIHQKAVQKVREFLDSDAFGINSIIVSEVFYKLSKIIGDREAHSRMKHILEHPSVQWLDFSIDTTTKAMDLSLKTKVRINDAMIAAQAMSFKAPVFTDNIKDFGKISGLKVMPLR